MKGPLHRAMIVVICLLSGAAVAQTHVTVRHHKEIVDAQPPEIAQAEDAIQKNDFAGAETLLRKALDTDPKNYQAWFDLGFVLNRLNRTDESIAAYRKSVAAKPDVFESNLNLGLMLARSNDPEAEQFLRAATTLKPTANSASEQAEGKERAWLAIAHLIENKKPADALVAYQKAAELTPKDPEPHLSSGLLHERQKEFPAAEAEYKQVLALDPKSTEATIGLANIEMKSGRAADAEPLLRRLAAERPDDAGLHLQLGRMLAAQGKTDDALVEMQAGVKLAPGDADAQRDVAELLVDAKKLPEAEAIYQNLANLHQNDAELHQRLGEVLLKERNFGPAEEEFLKAVKLKPDLGVAYGSLAVAANETENYGLTIKALEVRAKLLPETPVSYFLRATALDHLKNYPEAARYYHLFLDASNGKDPNDEWKARHRLVWIEARKH
ncbi:MAG TPA: tetratricopeptide repeat protein [Terriglobales bacterium]|nr:tetratricopeptide repeat protein [Terriglobales bacterium]